MEPCIVRFNRAVLQQRQLLLLSRSYSRSFAISTRKHEQRLFQNATSLSTIPTCPESTCECAPTPTMPEGLEIDRKSKLDSTAPAYDMHLIVHTGVSDWPSRIEDDGRFPEIKIIKEMLGKNGKYFNPFHNVMISTSDIAPSVHDSDPPEILKDAPMRMSLFSNSRSDKAESYHFYSPFEEIRQRGFSTSLEEAAETMIPEVLLPRSLSQQAMQYIPEGRHASLVRRSSSRQLSDYQPEDSVRIMICGHADRDQRCGITGPILAREFRKQLDRSRIDGTRLPPPSVELISHIGGHKYAGNVIIYFPAMADRGIHQSQMAGMGVWYGRVKPKHVEGILEQTIFGGRIIKELFRGGIDGCGGQLRLANVETVALATGNTGYRPPSGWLKPA